MSSIATLCTANDITHNGILRLAADNRAKGYDTVCLPLTTENWKQRWTKLCLVQEQSRRDSRWLKQPEIERTAEEWRRRPVFDRDEVTMTSLDEADGVVALISDWLQLDADDDWVRYDAELALHQELAYASYLNISSVILPPPRNRAQIASYARIVNSALDSSFYLHISIRLPIYDAQFQFANGNISSLSVTDSASPPPLTPTLVLSPSSGGRKPSLVSLSDNTGDVFDGMWEMWDTIRTVCGYNTRLSLALDLTPPLPTTLGVLAKWAAEAVKYIVVPASTFIANSKGYPVLPKVTQKFIRDSMSHHPTMILSGASAGLHTKGGEIAYSQYLRHLERTSPAVQASLKAGTMENFAQGYQDYLQAPLQPLMDNLASTTYQTFEQDPVKYRNYEEAIYRALLDWPREDLIIIYVVGAGRGPIVARCLNAIERSGKDAFVYALEKNPNAFVTLQYRKDKEWGDKVYLLFGDMRTLQVPEKADIIVSELLGSFGDNELSPECLDGAMRFLKPDGISIPSSYTAHLAPLSSSKLYNEARASKDPKGMETPYVVMLQAVNLLSADSGGWDCGPQVQECWEFEHPRKDVIVDETGVPLTNTHNARAAKLNFYIPHAGVLHGFAGYFEAVLYRNIGLSIHPHRKEEISKDMLSWFPLFFPLKEPLYLPSNSELHVSIWRLTNQRQVWYEWHAESFLPVSSMTPPRPRSDSKVWTPSSPQATAPSPLIDAIDIPSVEPPPMAQPRSTRLVKIGQTSLHNAGGRSSWIGL